MTNYEYIPVPAESVINVMHAVGVDNILDWIKNSLLNKIIDKIADKYTEKRIEDRVKQILENQQSNTRKTKEPRERCI